MKNPHYEHLGRRMREYHRSHAWRLSEGGLFIPHSYQEMGPDTLSYWDDVGFILNKRRVIVWWQHPRHIYSESVSERARQEVGDGPEDGWLFEGSTKNYKRVGKSGKRKKLVSYTCRPPSEAQQQHYAKLRAVEDRLTKEGIELNVFPHWKWQRRNWAMGVSLVAPLEVRSANDVAEVAKLARSLGLQQTSLDERFANAAYGKADWLRDQALLAAQRNAHRNGEVGGAKSPASGQ